jgi:hypothetical protein
LTADATLRGVSGYLRSIKPSVLWSSVVLWVLGAGLAVLGIVGDDRDWWKDRPFLTNLVSGVTGAGFGIPLALLVLSGLARRQAAWADSASFQRRSGAEIERLAFNVQDFSLTLDLPPEAWYEDLGVMRLLAREIAMGWETVEQIILPHQPSENAHWRRPLREEIAVVNQAIAELVAHVKQPLPWSNDVIRELKGDISRVDDGLWRIVPGYGLSRVRSKEYLEGRSRRRSES